MKKKLKSKKAEEVKVKKKLKSKSKDKAEGKLKKKGKKLVVQAKKRAKRSAPEVSVVKKELNQSGLIAHLADTTDLEPKVVKSVVNALRDTILGSVMPKGSGKFVFPGLFKIETKNIPKKKGGVKKANPFKPGEFFITKAKPATVKVKLRALSKIKAAALG